LAVKNFGEWTLLQIWQKKTWREKTLDASMQLDGGVA